MAVKYRPVLDTESKQMLHEVLSMNNLPQTLRRQAASTFLTIAYGYRLPIEPPEIQEMEELVSYMATISEACFRGTSVLAEFFPFAQYLPGNSWWKEEADKIAAKLTRFYVQKWRAGLETSAWNWTKEYNVHKEAQPMDELERAYTIGSIYEASLTPFEILLIVILAALYNPEETRRIQRAIDAVVGGANRMPESSDMATDSLLRARGPALAALLPARRTARRQQGGRVPGVPDSKRRNDRREPVGDGPR
jgi:fumitremorgin C synthase